MPAVMIHKADSTISVLQPRFRIRVFLSYPGFFLSFPGIFIESGFEMRSDPVVEMRSDPDSVFKIWSHLDSGFKIWSHPDSVVKICSDPVSYCKSKK